MHLGHMHDCGTTAAVPKSAAMAALLGRPYIYEIGALPKKGQPSLSEIAISLNCEQNSARKFQTGVSNSGAQIPKHARQNSEVPEITYFS